MEKILWILLSQVKHLVLQVPNKKIASIWQKNMLDFLCSEKQTVSWECSLRKTVSFEEGIMPKSRLSCLLSFKYYFCNTWSFENWGILLVYSPMSARAQVSAANEWDIKLNTRDKIHIPTWACNILYVLNVGFLEIFIYLHWRDRRPFGFVSSTSLDIWFFLSGSTLMLVIFRTLVKLRVRLAKIDLH